MKHLDSFYAGGRWVRAAGNRFIDVVNPATDAVIGRAPAGDASDVHIAVSAARRAFDGWAAWPTAERVAALDRIRAGLERRAEEFARCITTEMGSPLAFSKQAQVGLGLKNLDIAARAMQTLHLEETIGTSLVVREPIGVVGAITPWNFPLHQITAKIAPALAAGCTVVLKPSELTPLDACLLAQVVHEAGLPPGVFNLVLGTGAQVGEALVRHPEVDMVSFTGSTRAGQRVAELACGTLKKVALELGGKSANVLLDDAELDVAVPTAVKQCFANAGQACACLSRLLVPRPLMQSVRARVIEAASAWTVGDPLDEGTKMGPLASRLQQQRVRGHIATAVSEGARLLLGGVDQPAHLPRGAYVQPTVFDAVQPGMALAREEVFGPVLALFSYDTDDEAIAMANDSVYGLSGGVWSGDAARAVQVARRIRTGQVVINGAPLNVLAPFGGYKLSGLGREYGRHGLEEFFQLKSIQGAVRA